MVFNSLTFIVFFAVVLLLHALPFSWRTKKFNLLVASYLFYAAWNPPFVFLLILSAVVDFFLAKWIYRTTSVGGRQALLCASLILNLGLLSYFKYGKFLLANFVWVLNLVGIHFQAAPPDIVLPLGISFYTFETISYLVDVYRGKIKPWDSFLDYALFLTFFPHLVAGPIVRASDFLPQCVTPRQGTPRQMGWGFALLIVGLFEKVILADGILAPVVDKVFSAPERSSFADAWLGTLAFSGQIYFDFAGYSTCAIGIALALGFVLNDNFHCPYAAIGFSDFWRRWHISLSSWLRDYLYIPLGGNRHGTVRTYFNLMLTMLLGGLWHGASWQFVVWGGLHGIYLAGERVFGGLFGESAWVKKSVVRLGLALLTFLLVCITWVFFRAESFSTAFQLMATMLVPSAQALTLSHLEATSILVVVGMLVAVHWLMRDTTLEHVVERMPWWARAAGLTACLIGLMMTSGDDRAFIYFQF
jgi:D-alanyl-lipoteichoic acid acyltransferase DltB (MBOAT superfamily)